MPAIQEPNLAINYGWSVGENGWATGVDANWLKIGALLHLAVISKALATPPASPAEGDRYIIPADATGAWSGLTGQIAVRINGTWTFYIPKEGWQCWVADEATMYVRHSAAWVSQAAAQPYDLHSTFNGRPDSGITLIRVVLPRATTFPSGLAGSQAKSEIAATASATFALTKNGASIGSINWGVGATTATFTFATQQSFVAGDVLELTAPGTSDATLADLAITLVGWR